MSSRSGIESSRVTQATKNERVNGLMTLIRSSRRGRNRSRLKAVCTSCGGCSGDSSGWANGSFRWFRTDMYEAADSETISLTRRSRSSAPFLTESSESAASCLAYVSRPHPHLRACRVVLTLHKASNTWLKYTSISPFATFAILYMLSHA